MFYKTNVHRENAVSVVETDNYPSLWYAYTENAPRNNCAKMRFLHICYCKNALQCVSTDTDPQRIDFKAFTHPHHVSDNQLVTSALIKRDYFSHRNTSIAAVLDIGIRKSKSRYFFINSINIFTYENKCTFVIT